MNDCEQSEEMNHKIAVASGWTELRERPEWYGRNPEGDYGRVYDWWNDLNIAWYLFLELPSPAYIYGQIWFDDGDMDYINPYDTTPQSLAQAICEAWLQWKGISDE